MALYTPVQTINKYVSGSHRFLNVDGGSTSVPTDTLVTLERRTVMTIQNCNVGIGTTIPMAPLDLYGNMLITGDILPSQCNVFNLGSSNFRFKDIFLSGNTIDLGGTLLTRDTTNNGLKIIGASGDPLDTTVKNLYTIANIGIGTTLLGTHGLVVTGSASVTGSLSAISITSDNATISGTLVASNLTVLGSNTIVDTYTIATSNVSICNVTGVGPALEVSQQGLGAGYPIADFYDVDVSTTIPALRIADGGNVGLGTSLPMRTLDVIGDINATGSNISTAFVGGRFHGDGSGLSNVYATGQLMQLNDNLGLRAPVDNFVVDGNLLVVGNIVNLSSTDLNNYQGSAVIPPSWTSTGVITGSNIAPLSVTFDKLDPTAYNFQWASITGGGLRTDQRVVINNDIVLTGKIYNAYGTNINSLYPSAGVIGCNMAVGVVNTSNLVDGAVTISKLDLSGSGNVGIGTTIPQSTLDVNGNIKATNMFCYGQTWQDVTASRAISTTYTNTTGKPIIVVVGVTLSNTTTFTNLIISGVNASRTQGTSAGAYTYDISAVVPPGATYQVSGGSPTLSSWRELR